MRFNIHKRHLQPHAFKVNKKKPKNSLSLQHALQESILLVIMSAFVSGCVRRIKRREKISARSSTLKKLQKV